jgi:hypothetical protein
VFQAGPLIESDPARAREIIEQGLAAHPESQALKGLLSRF